MRLLLTKILIVFGFGASALSAELIQLVLADEFSTTPRTIVSDVITLGEGDSARLLFSNGQYQAEIRYTYAGNLFQVRDNDKPIILIGPATIQLVQVNAYRGEYVALFQVNRADSPEGAIMVPKDDPTATFEVFMEASTDMETWVRVIPGDYDASGGAKFFRVRMVKK